MKKIVSLLLVVIMTFSLCACSGAQETDGKAEKHETLRVGFGKAKIQPPDLTIRLTGGGDPNRFVTGVLDEMYLTCIAVTDTEGNNLLFYTVDIQNFANSWGKHAQKFVSERTGIPTTHIFFGCTHTHSTPELCYDTEANRKFCKVFEEGLI